MQITVRCEIDHSFFEKWLDVVKFPNYRPETNSQQNGSSIDIVRVNYCNIFATPARVVCEVQILCRFLELSTCTGLADNT